MWGIGEQHQVGHEIGSGASQARPGVGERDEADDQPGRIVHASAGEEVLWKVVFPMCRAGLFATAIFTFVFAWNEFIFALVLTRTEVTTYTVQVTHYFGGQSNFWAKISAMSVLGTLPIFIVVAFMQRYLVRGSIIAGGGEGVKWPT